MEYAAGSLGEAKALLVATHMALCPACRAAVASGEAASAVLAFGEPDDVAGAVPDVTGEPVEPVPAVASTSSFVPEPLRSYLDAPLPALAWSTVGRGMRAHVLRGFRGRAAVRMLSIEPGARMPRHTHNGEELTLVLQGSFSDASGRYVRGDVGTANESVDHAPHAGVEGECVCLAVEDAPLRFTGWKGPFLTAAARWRGFIG